MNGEMWLAIKSCNEQKVRELVAQGEGVDIPEPNTGFTYLMFNACCGNRAINRILVQAGCPVNAINKSGNTALHLAVYYLKYGIAFDLLELGANARIKNRFNITALHLAVVNLTHIDLIEEVIPNGAHIREKNGYYLQSLHFATARSRRSEATIRKAIAENRICRNSIILVRQLLSAKSDVNAKDVNNCTPIQLAVYTGDLELVRILITAGAKVNNQNGIGASPLHDAILCGNEQMVNLLLCRGASVAAKTVYGDTPLHWAAMLTVGHSHAAILTRLLEFRSQVNDLNVRGQTPFDMLLQNGDANTVKHFVESYSANMKVNENMTTALHYAASNPDPGVMKLVLERTPEIAVDQACDNGWTALHIASKESRPQNVRELLAREADVNAKDKAGKTALFLSAINAIQVSSRTGRDEVAKDVSQVIELLLEHGTDLNQKILQGETQKTILEAAIQEKRYKTAHTIIMHAAKVETITKRPLFDNYNFRIIMEDRITRIQYTIALSDLKKMSKVAFEGTWITQLSLLCRPEEEVVRYVRNKDLVRQFEASYDGASYVYSYGPLLKAKFDAAVAKQKRIENVCDILIDTLPFVCPDITIYEKIYSYLSETDVNILIERAENSDMLQ